MTTEPLTWAEFQERVNRPFTEVGCYDLIFHVREPGYGSNETICRHCVQKLLADIQKDLSGELKQTLNTLAYNIIDVANDCGISIDFGSAMHMLDFLPDGTHEDYFSQIFAAWYEITVESSSEFDPGHLFCDRCGADVSAYVEDADQG